MNSYSVTTMKIVNGELTMRNKIVEIKFCRIKLVLRISKMMPVTSKAIENRNTIISTPKFSSYGNSPAR